MNDRFQIGTYRPIYLWGGPGTIRMNRLKFMNQPVDEAAHLEAYQPEAALRVINDIYSNWVHLTYDWGFPPEVEEEDWRAFEQAAAVYHQAGGKVFAYIQSSNCVFEGSHQEKDWYARDARGRKIYYYSGRFMTCLQNPAWRKHLKALARGAMERGADGIFFDNLWHGAMPAALFGTWLGSAGCHCPRCQALYQGTAGQMIPREVQPGDPEASRYLRWRADQMTNLICELREYIEDLWPGTPISANDYDFFSRNTYLVFGQDLESLATVQDVVMIENHALVKWENENGQERLVNNALILRNARRLVDDQAHLNALSYEMGIGFDGLYPARRYQQAIGEAAACGASMTIKGTEYFVNGRHTLLTPATFAEQQMAIGDYQRWLTQQTGLYRGGSSAAPVGLLYPGERLWLDWRRIAPLYLGAGQALTQAGIPWRVVTEEDYQLGNLDELKALLVFEQEETLLHPSAEGPAMIEVRALSGWAARDKVFLERVGPARRAVTWAAESLMTAYFSSRAARVAMDWLGMSSLVTRSPVFDLPSRRARAALLAALPDGLYPHVMAAEPVLVEAWRRAEGMQVHLLNYSRRPQKVRAAFGEQVTVTAISPDKGAPQTLRGETIEFEVDIYSVLQRHGE